jgi:hypothetical protein
MRLGNCILKKMPYMAFKFLKSSRANWHAANYSYHSISIIILLISILIMNHPQDNP